jgi:hypothetical protein
MREGHRPIPRLWTLGERLTLTAAEAAYQSAAT